MSFMAVTGVTGCGKTLAMVFLMLRNYVLKNRRIFSNFHFHRDPIIAFLSQYYERDFFDYEYIEDSSQMEKLRDGVFFGDELWSWLDSRMSGKPSNRTKSIFLLKLRKRGVDVIYSCQMIHTMEKRIRENTEFEAEPILVKNNKVCILNIYSLNTATQKRIKKLDTFKFDCPPLWEMYDTEEEIEPEY